MSAKKKTICEWETERDLELIDGPTFFGLVLDDEQKEFKNAILNEDKLLIICDAAAGSGKTTIAAGTAEILHKTRKYEGIIYITAPVQEPNMGFLPGTIEEKTDVYSEPFMAALRKIGVNPYVVVKRSEEDEKYGDAYIECRPHTYMRGLDIENKIVIIDEAQNFTTSELKKVLTRMHDNCKVILIGHTAQCDLKTDKLSGFHSYLEAADSEDWIQVCHLTKNYRGKLSNWADNVQKTKTPVSTYTSTK